ncbi:MAG: ABC transporter permease [Chloroflexi bacterium]|nr:ABC transporter permease [Chloroflexota bacterium]MBV9547709.1 ABC transporter permease [Chloroflexota bacterium]
MLAFSRRNPLVIVGVVVVLAWVLISITAPVLTPYGPLTQRVSDRLQPPSSTHLFGTDSLGRDIFSRVAFGGRISLPVGFGVVIVSLIVGGIIGSVAGFGPGWLDGVLMRLTEMVMAFPIIILAMTIAAALGPGLDHAMVALVAVSWPRYARVIRGLVLSVKENEYVHASRALGASEVHILNRVVLPNCLAPAVVMATLDLGNAILTFSGLSFLGLGSPPPAPEWGAMVAAGTQTFDQWWVSTFPGAAILSLVMAFNFIGDGVRDALDPRLRRSL